MRSRSALAALGGLAVVALWPVTRTTGLAVGPAHVPRRGTVLAQPVR